MIFSWFMFLLATFLWLIGIIPGWVPITVFVLPVFGTLLWASFYRPQ